MSESPIIELLKTENVRINYGRRWLFYDEDLKLWTVCEHKYRKQNVTIITRTESEKEAVEVLMD